MRELQFQDPMTTDKNRLRSELINTKVIANNSAKQLGVVKELLVDIDRREVVALGLRDNLLAIAGMPSYLLLESITKTGDVILVDREDVIVDIDVDVYSKLINCEVITETGELLGRVRDFQFNLETGTVSSLIIASIGLPQIPDQVISTYQLPVEEIVSSGPNRLIVFEGAEDRVTQLTVGLLERLGIGRPPWEREDDEVYYPPVASADKQLGTGVPLQTPATARPVEARVPEYEYEEAWTEDDDLQYAEAQPLPARQPETIRYQEYEDDYEEDNWGDAPANTSYQTRAYVEPEPPQKEYEYDEMQEDVWDDDVKPESYKPPRLNIPEKTKAPEYEEESY